MPTCALAQTEPQSPVGSAGDAEGQPRQGAGTGRSCRRERCLPPACTHAGRLTPATLAGTGNFFTLAVTANSPHRAGPRDRLQTSRRPRQPPPGSAPGSQRPDDGLRRRRPVSPRADPRRGAAAALRGGAQGRFPPCPPLRSCQPPLANRRPGRGTQPPREGGGGRCSGSRALPRPGRLAPPRRGRSAPA